MGLSSASPAQMANTLRPRWSALPADNACRDGGARPGRLGGDEDCQVSGGAKEIVAVERLTVAERAARGRGARGEVPRSVHANWEVPLGRPDPVELLEA